MAKIRVYRDEAGGDEFPRLCVRCGEGADGDSTQNFSWVPEWVPILILGGLLPWLLVAMILKKSMRVTLPVCRRHRRHWLRRTLYIWLGLLGWVVAGVLAVVLLPQLPQDAVPVVLGVLVFGGLLWLIVGVVYTNSGIKPRQITDRWIELKGISPVFAEAWDEARPPVAPVVRRPRRPVRQYEDGE
jgi:hypothetical protein